MKDEKIVKSYYIIASIYYLPYLFLGWGAVAGVKEDEVPLAYKIFQVIIPMVFIFFINKKIKFSKNFSVFMAFVLFLMISAITLLNFKNINTEIIKSLFFYFLYIFIKSLDIKVFESKFYIKIILIVFIFVIIEKFFLETYLGIKPIFFMDWQERSIGNMGGPNTLGAFTNFLYTIILFSEYPLKKIKFIVSIISLYIILCTDSQGALLIFILINALMIYLKNKKFFLIWVLLTMFLVLININNLLKKLMIFLSDGSNIERLKSLEKVIRSIEILKINSQLISNESPYLEILNNYGLLIFLILILFLFSIFFCNIKGIKNKKERNLKLAIYIQMIVYSLFLPVIYIFPLNLMYILILKTRGKEEK